MRYAQIKEGNKLHLVFESDGYISAPLCGKHFDGHYRMTINVPLAHACKNCQRIYRQNGGYKIKNRFYNFLLKDKADGQRETG